MRELILETFFDVYMSHNNTDEVPSLNDDTVLLESGLDSLGFAILVVTLEQRLGFDPFLLDDNAYYPKTFIEFVSYYENCNSK